MFTEPDLAHITAGNDHLFVGDYEAAIAEYDVALMTRNSPQAHWNRSKALLALGRYKEGFSDYQARFTLFGNEGMLPTARRIKDNIPRWRFQKLPGKHLILLHEGGMGDTIMLMRYIPLLQAMGARVEVDVPIPLQSFFSRVAPLTLGFGDICAPFFDLPWVLATTPETIPATGYFLPEVAHCERWAKKLDALRPRAEGRRRVGVCWSSGYRAEDRSLPLRTLLDVLDRVDEDRDCDFFSLQIHDAPEAEAAAVLAPRYKDFDDLAAAMIHMDAIISVDSAPLHLAGTIGHPNVVGLLSYVPEWRWLAPWYPNTKLVRQTSPGDWASAIRQI